MSEIYDILPKFFDGKAIPEEEKVVQQFKLENPKEYETIRAFWINKPVKLSKFDTAKGWEAVRQKAKPPAKRVPIYPYLRRIASIAAIFLLALTGVYFYLLPKANSAPKLVEVVGTEQGNQVTLEDGSIVYLNKQAVLTYPNFFDTSLREVNLQGEAFFEVNKDTERPFIVNTPHSKVEVLGTSFNINIDQNQTQVSVTTGKVQVDNLGNKESSILTPNQTATVTKQTLEVYATSNKNHLSWRTGVFEFENASLDKMVKDLTSYYGDKIILNTKAENCSFSSTFNQRDLKDILEIIQLSCELELTTKGDGKFELR